MRKVSDSFSEDKSLMDQTSKLPFGGGNLKRGHWVPGRCHGLGGTDPFFFKPRYYSEEKCLNNMANTPPAATSALQILIILQDCSYLLVPQVDLVFQCCQRPKDPIIGNIWTHSNKIL